VSAPKRVCVDLDHVLACPSGPSIGEPYEGAKFFLKMLQTFGMEIVIHTARIDPLDPTPAQVSMVRSWLDKHDLPYDWVCGKPEAIAYIDDRAIPVPLGPSEADYDRVLHDMQALFFRQTRTTA